MARWHTTEWDTLPENAFQHRGWKGSMTLEGGKGGGGSAPAPDPNIGLAQKQMADLSSQQWDMFKTTIYPELLKQSQAQQTLAEKQQASADTYSQSAIAQSQKMTDLAAQEQARMADQYAYAKSLAEEQRGYAQQDRARYEQGAIPAMEKLKAEADLYNTEAERERLAGLAMGDIKSAAENARQQQMMQQRAYGIDPTSGVAQGQANANAIQLASAQAAAANQTRQAAKELGLQKQANVYNMYAGLPAQSATATGLGLNATQTGTASSAAGFGAQGTAANYGLNATNAAMGYGMQGFGAGQSAFGNLATMGSSLNSATSTGLQGWQGLGQLGVGKYNADVSAYNAQQAAAAQSSAGFGSALGTLGMAAMSGGTGGFATSALGRLFK